jgi:stage IV sporulation protein FB
MRWSFTIAKVAGIQIKVHITFLLLLAWVGTGYYTQGGREAASVGLLFLLLLFASVLVHELGHAFAARRFGIQTPDITLLPIGGVARVARMPDDPKQEFLIALAGPATSLLLALVLYLAHYLAIGPVSAQELQPSNTQPLLARLLVANVGLALFNLLPAFPLDGGRMLRALLAMRMSYVKATTIAARLGQGLAFLLGFAGLFGNSMLLFIALFVYLGATQEAAATQMKDVSDRLPLSAALVTEFHTLEPDATLGDAADVLLRTHQHDFPVVDPGGRLQGILIRDDLVAGLKRSGPGTPVVTAMRTDLIAVPRNTSLTEAFRTMQTSRSSVLPVHDETGRLVGLLTPENVGEMVIIHGALGPDEAPAWWAGKQPTPWEDPGPAVGTHRANTTAGAIERRAPTTKRVG